MEGSNTNEEMKSFLEDFGKIFELADFDTVSIMQVYDKISARHAKFMPDKSMGVHQMLVDRVFKYVEEVDKKLEKNCSILDVCCGTGIMGICLRKAGFTGRLEGVDGSKGMLSQVEKLENVYDKLYQEVIELDGVKTLQSQTYGIVTVGHAFFPDCLHADHIDALLELLQAGGLLAFNLHYDKVEEKTSAMRHLEKMDAKVAQLIQSGICERVFECDVDGVFPRLSHICPFGDSEFIHERHICLKKL